MTTQPIQLLRTARNAIQQQDYAAAVDAMQQLVVHDRETDNRQLEIIHLGNLALLQNRLGLSDTALENLERALELAREEQDRASEDGILGNMGTILRELGQHEDAMNRLNEALIVAQEIGDTRGRGNWLSALGLTYDDLQQPEDALACHQESVEIARKLGDNKGLAMRLGQLGNTLMGLGQVDEALTHYHESVHIYRNLSDQSALALRLGIIGNIYGELGRNAATDDQKETYFVQALAHYRETLSIARDLDDQMSVAALLRGMGNVYGNMGNYTEAINHFNNALEIFESLGMTEQAERLQENIELARQLRNGDG